MSIHRQEFDGQQIKMVDMSEKLPSDGRITESVMDLGKRNFLYILGGFEAEDNVPRDADDFKRNIAHERPLLYGFLQKLQNFTDTTPHYNILTQGYKLMTSSNARSISSLVGYYPIDPEPDIHLVSHPSLEGCMQEYKYTHADPKHHFSDHAMQIVMATLGKYVGKDLCVKKDQHGQWQVTGHKLPMAEVLDAAHNLTIMGNSFGSLIIAQYENALKYTLGQLHYSPREVRKIMQSVRAFSIGTVSPFNALTDSRAKPDPRFTMVALEGVNDVVAKLMNPSNADLTEEEVRRWIPPEQQENFFNALHTYQQQIKDSMRDPIAHPFPDSADPATQPDILPNRRFFILRKIAPNRLHILTAVPTFTVRWLFDATGAHTDGILADLRKLSDTIMPEETAQEAQKMGSTANHIQLGSVIRLGGEVAENRLLKLLGDIKPNNVDEARALFKEVIRRRNEFEQYLRKIEGDRAGHGITFYLWPAHPLSHLCRRIAHNALTGAHQKGVEGDVLDLLNPVDPGFDTMKRFFDAELDPLIDPQVEALRESRHARGPAR